MKERPIIFNTENVKAILEGRKTQTRRVMKPQPEYREYGQGYFWKKGKMVYGLPNQGGIDDRLLGIWAACPYGQDRLWVKETWFLGGIKPNEWAWYKAGFKGDALAVLWRPSIFMPRWASRINLEITEIRVERLQEISDQDCQAEGCQYPQWRGSHTSWKGAFKALWDSLNAKRGYPFSSNCWVWVITFKPVKEEKDDNR